MLTRNDLRLVSCSIFLGLEALSSIVVYIQVIASIKLHKLSIPVNVALLLEARSRSKNVAFESISASYGTF